MYEKRLSVVTMQGYYVANRFYVITGGDVVHEVNTELWGKIRQNIGFDFKDLQLVRVLEAL